MTCSALAKGTHLWRRWHEEGRSLYQLWLQPTSCSCRYCMWSLEGARNPSQAWRCEWQGGLECLAYAVTNRKSNCLTAQLYAGELSLGKIVAAVRTKL